MQIHSISYEKSLSNRSSASFRKNNFASSFSNSEKMTFGNNALNVSDVIYVGAECPPYWKVGGVATVMNDYKGLGNTTIIPVYNGKIEYDPETGNPIGTSAKIHQLQDGTPIMTNQDLNTQTIDDVIKKNQYRRLEEVAKKNLEWGLDKNDEIKLYRVVPTDAEIKAAQDQGIPLRDNFVVYTDATAEMPKPYANGQYAFKPKQDLPKDTGMWKGDAYAKFDKSVVEFLEDLNAEGKIKTVVWSDAQCAYGPHYMAQKVMQGNKTFENISASYVEHNMGRGYTGTTGPRSMVVNLASTDQIKAISEDPEYIEALKLGKTDDYFKKFIGETLDDFGNPNATMIPLKYHDQGFVVAATTVSEKYAEAAANNSMVAPELTTMLKKLESQKKGGGILNPLNDPNVNPYKPLPLAGYGKDQIIEVNGTKEKIKAFDTFSENMTLKQVKEVKRKNKINLFKRLSGKYTQSSVLNGLEGKPVELFGSIDKKWVKALEAKKDVKLFVSWGRGDFQKGLDLVMASFKKFANTKEGKNAVLVLGGSLDPSNPESKKIKSELTELLNDSNLKGRVCFMEGFAPAYALASASDASIFPSRFAPCELTDLETQKYFSTVIATNTQGLAQKNFDPRIASEKAKATSYKTTHEFQMGHKQLKELSPEYSKEFETLLNSEKKILEVRGVKSEKINDIAMKKIFDSEAFESLYRKFADSSLVDELAECMKAKAIETKDTSELIFQNLKNLKTGWNNNGALHPSGETSLEMYKRLHFDTKAKKPEKILFSFDNSILERIKKTTNQISDTVVQSVTKTAKEGIKSSNKKIVAVSIAASSAVTGIICYLGFKSSTKAKTSNTLRTSA